MNGTEPATQTPSGVIRVIAAAVGKCDEQRFEERLTELKGLIEAAGGQVVAWVTQIRPSPDAATYVGKGKAAEIRTAALSTGAELLVVDDELSGSKLRNLQELTDMRVIDRTALILDIFATRSRSFLSKAQVELAQLQYRRSRLAGFGREMSQQGGGIGTRGPGETQLERDRRQIDLRIRELRRQIREQESVVKTQRRRRRQRPEPIVALVGYTNAGKSSVMNWFLEHFQSAGSPVPEKDMLFATVDTYLRRISLDSSRSFLLADTVGFVSRLPHQLVEAFRTTLDEAAQADLLLQVLDSNDDTVEMQAAATAQVLAEIGAADIERIDLLNKWDLPGRHGRLPGAIRVSARTGEGMDAVIRQIDRVLFRDHQTSVLFFPYAKGAAMSRLLAAGTVLKRQHTEEGTYLTMRTDTILRRRFADFLVDQVPDI